MLRQSKSALDEEIASALYKWRMAAAYYESAKDGDLMEYAIYELEAAKRRYTYLLSAKAKRRVTGAIPGERGNIERYNCSAVGIRHTVACVQGAENIAEDILETVR